MKTLKYITQTLFLATGLFLFSGLAIANEKSIASDNKINVTIEKELIVEDWMVELSEWNTLEYSFIVASESDIEIEDWMLVTNCEQWNSSDKVSEEKDIELEEWMTNLNKW